MLRAVDVSGESVAVFPNNAAPATALPVSAISYASAGRYGQKRLNVPAIAITVGLHLALIAGLASIHHQSEQKRRDRLTVVDLRSPPPPPPPAQEVPTPKSPIVVPQPKLQIAQSVAAVVTVPEPTPEEPVEQAVINPPAPPAPPAPPSTVTSSDLGTRMISGAPPRYPTECRRKREQGTVVLALVLGLDGRVENISIARSSGFERLDSAARNAVKNWRWAQTMRDGQAVKVKGVVEIPFVLQG